MPYISLTGCGISLRAVIRRLMNFFLSSSKKLGGGLATSLNSFPITFVNHSCSALFLDMLFFGGIVSGLSWFGLVSVSASLRSYRWFVSRLSSRWSGNSIIAGSSWGWSGLGIGFGSLLSRDRLGFFRSQDQYWVGCTVVLVLVWSQDHPRVCLVLGSSWDRPGVGY